MPTDAQQMHQARVHSTLDSQIAARFARGLCMALGNLDMENKHRPAFRPIPSMILFGILAACVWQIKTYGFYPPHGNPVLYGLGASLLIAIAMAILASASFKARPKLFRLASWERGGEIYDRIDVRVYKWVLLHSPLSWLNPYINLAAGRRDCERLAAETCSAEGVHWSTLLISSILSISLIFDGYAVHGYVMLLIRVPFDIYPIMLQRHTRGRLYRAMHRRPDVAFGCVPTHGTDTKAS